MRKTSKAKPAAPPCAHLRWDISAEMLAGCVVCRSCKQPVHKGLIGIVRDIIARLDALEAKS